jgi:hypothetical protein
MFVDSVHVHNGVEEWQRLRNLRVQVCTDSECACTTSDCGGIHPRGVPMLGVAVVQCKAYGRFVRVEIREQTTQLRLCSVRVFGIDISRVARQYSREVGLAPCPPHLLLDSGRFASVAEVEQLCSDLKCTVYSYYDGGDEAEAAKYNYSSINKRGVESITTVSMPGGYGHVCSQNLFEPYVINQTRYPCNYARNASCDWFAGYKYKSFISGFPVWENLAFQRPATQSSTSLPLFPACKGTDQSTVTCIKTGSSATQSLSSLNRQTDPWWQVDLAISLSICFFYPSTNK